MFGDDKDVAEVVTEKGVFSTRVETRYIERGKKTRSIDMALNKPDGKGGRMTDCEQVGKLLKEQVVDKDMPTEPWDSGNERTNALKSSTSTTVRETIKKHLEQE